MLHCVPCLGIPFASMRMWRRGCQPCGHNPGAAISQRNTPSLLQDRVRALHRDVLRLACSLHPPHKVGRCWWSLIVLPCSGWEHVVTGC